MRRNLSWILSGLAISLLLLVVPGWSTALLFLVLLAWVPRKASLLGFLGFGLLWNLPFLGLLSGDEPAWSLGPFTLSGPGLLEGVWLSTRFATLLGWSLLWPTQLDVPLLLRSLPPSWRRFMGPLLAQVICLQRDLQRQALAAPSSHRIRYHASVLPMVLARALQRGQEQGLQASTQGDARGAWTLIAWVGLGLALRVGFAGLPNVSPVFVLVIAAGAAHGAAFGFAVGGLVMALSNLALTGFLPTSFVNVVPMALLGAMGPALSRFLRYPPLAAIVGVAATFAFSFLSDFADWILLPELRGDVAILQARILAGWLFNILPALLHGWFFLLAWPGLSSLARRQSDFSATS